MSHTPPEAMSPETIGGTPHHRIINSDEQVSLLHAASARLEEGMEYGTISAPKDVLTRTPSDRRKRRKKQWKTLRARSRYYIPVLHVGCVNNISGCLTIHFHCMFGLLRL